LTATSDQIIPVLAVNAIKAAASINRIVSKEPKQYIVSIQPENPIR
jgi:hypothetical protein